MAKTRIAVIGAASSTFGPKLLRDVAHYKDIGPATCVPTAVAMAATWNTRLIEEVGDSSRNGLRARLVVTEPRP